MHEILEKNRLRGGHGRCSIKYELAFSKHKVSKKDVEKQMEKHGKIRYEYRLFFYITKKAIEKTGLIIDSVL